MTALPSAGEALSRLDAGERWDAILCDFMMPDIDGIGFFEAVAARFPSLLPRLAFMSGGVFGERASAFLATHEILGPGWRHGAAAGRRASGRARVRASLPAELLGPE